MLIHIKKAKFLVTLAIGGVLISGCATVPYQGQARDVKRKPGEGGVVAVSLNHRPEDRAKADQMMATVCGPNAAVKVLEESEVQVGEKVRSVADTNRNQQKFQDSGLTIGGLRFGSMSRPEESTTTETEKVAVKEWQINYSCVALAPEPSLQKVNKKASISKTSNKIIQ